MNFTSRDKQVIGTGLLLAAGGFVATYLGIIGLKAEMMMGYIPGLFVPFAIFFIWKARSLWGGDFARYLEVIASGLLIQFLIYDIHLHWHFQEILAGALPAWGMTTSFWRFLFHGLSALSFVIIAYGFYLFWKESAK